eukprot:4494193-Alexandrium_andersonii.AAC.1
MVGPARGQVCGFHHACPTHDASHPAADLGQEGIQHAQAAHGPRGSDRPQAVERRGTGAACALPGPAFRCSAGLWGCSRVGRLL